MFSIVKFAKKQTQFIINNIIKKIVYDFTKGKRVRELSQVKISLPSQQPQQEKAVESIDYSAMMIKLRELNWESMQFDKLCALPQQTIAFINMEIKKDKFNVDDSEFQDFSVKDLHIKRQENSKVLEKLNPFYRKMYHLLLNNHQKYNELLKPNYEKPYYLNEMYIMDLEKQGKLKNSIEYFINNINHPRKLELVAEPTFIKHLLSTKRELIMQGIHFESQKEEKMIRKIQRKREKQKNNKNQVDINREKEEKEEQQSQFQSQEYEKNEEIKLSSLQDLESSNQQNIDNDNKFTSKIDEFISESLKSSKHKVNILNVLGYEYEFWVDVKHNRSKNGVEQDYVIEERQIQNPNNSMIVRQKFPKIKVRYIVHKRKRKNYSMHFCIKTNLLIDVSGSHRNVKVEWRGPSSNNKENQQETTFIVIDYEYLMKGNPTIKPVFFF